ncbi:MAG: glycoside hydrolase family 88 protein [Cyclobacteriaceae bacterium]
MNTKKFINSTKKAGLAILLLAVISNPISALSLTKKDSTNNQQNSKKNHPVISAMEQVAQWQMDNISYTFELPDGTVEPLLPNNWIRATFLSGMMALYEIGQDTSHLNFVKQQAEEVEFQLGDRERHADEHAIGKVYADLFLLSRDQYMIDDMIETFDEIISEPSRGPVVGWSGEQNWSWCDAMFMAPPAWIKLYTCTGKRIYLNEMNEMFWETNNYLYSPEDSLYYRDGSYKWDENGNGRKTSSGKKIFWGRGIGWVIGGLAEMLTYMPGDFPDRPKYIQLYKEMISKVASLQAKDGMWRSSLYDFEEFPTVEMSASSFFCFGMAWGINHNILDPEEFAPKVEKAWAGMMKCIQENGKVGYVQRVGSDPRSVDKDDTMDYGPGAFLLAGKEVYELSQKGLIKLPKTKKFLGGS